MPIYNFIHEQTPKRDVKLLFGDFIDAIDEVIYFSSQMDLADLGVASKVYPSRTQAKVNGWRGPIPRGWKEVTIGRQRYKAYIYWPSELEANGFVARVKDQLTHLLLNRGQPEKPEDGVSISHEPVVEPEIGTEGKPVDLEY